MHCFFESAGLLARQLSWHGGCLQAAGRLLPHQLHMPQATGCTCPWLHTCSRPCASRVRCALCMPRCACHAGTLALAWHARPAPVPVPAGCACAAAHLQGCILAMSMQLRCAAPVRPYRGCLQPAIMTGSTVFDATIMMRCVSHAAAADIKSYASRKIVQSMQAGARWRCSWLAWTNERAWRPLGSQES